MRNTDYQSAKLTTVNINAASAAAAGTVMIQAATIVAKCDRRTNFRLRSTSLSIAVR
jgi:hypothetical protein